MAEMTKAELDAKSELHKSNIDDWKLYELVWRSGKALIDEALYRHPSESVENHTARLRDGYVFNFGKAIVDIYSFYLNEREVIRELGSLYDDPQWRMFIKDTDLTGTDYDVFLDEAQKLASVFGSVGILVNKPGNSELQTIEDEIKNGVYPYYSMYSPPNIYEWEWEKDPVTHRRYLSFLKLRESNGDYLIWTRNSWQIWRLHEKTGKPVLYNIGQNSLGVIPFVWMVNVKDLTNPEVGSSDLVDISRIVTSIAQNLSCGEEMIKLAGFPIRRQPMETDSFGSAEEQEVPTGPRAVEEFNPEFGEAGKPDWMPTEIYAPVEATLKWIDRKTDEIYRIAHLSGVHGQRKSNNEVASGLALRYELSQLNSVMIAKSVNQNEAELSALKYWLMWQNKLDWFKNIDIYRKRDFSIDELSVSLDNSIKAYRNVMSKTFRTRVMQRIATHTLPDLSEKDKESIEKEIADNIPDKVDIIMGPSGGDGRVRTALAARADHSDDE